MMDSYAKASLEAMAMVENGFSGRKILSFLAIAGETAAGSDSFCSILILDENGLLRNGASPSLPIDYLRAIDGIKPDKSVGTCAAAAATGRMVITRDFFADEKWLELRHLPMSIGFRGAWSQPIVADDGSILGTFGTYYTSNRTPTEAEVAGVEKLAKVASVAISRNEMSLKAITP
jgi:GAF domain-containing protein